jgi:hypothetical protein
MYALVPDSSTISGHRLVVACSREHLDELEKQYGPPSGGGDESGG